MDADDRIAALVNEYFDRRQAGERLNPDQFSHEHPDIADDLRPYLEGLTLLDHIRTSTHLGEMAAEREMEPAASSNGLPTIEGYKLLKEIGRGGMGVVFKALQIATKRVVAIKVMIAGPFASPQVQRRFEREVELAARLRHPSVVAVLESGTVATGQKYFAMDYVDGMHLDTFNACERPRLRVLLDLFIQICQAIDYAHRNGIVHRDLKPANVLIDAEGKPYVMDFGLAKATDQADGEDALTTICSDPGQVMGTLRYLSPEQASGATAELDVRTDVYSLGVMLYEALTGRFPYDVTGRPSEIIRRIIDVQPAAPSSFAPNVDNELETILLKALAKEPERRYKSIGEIAEDLRRYLGGEPILAKRASRVYILRKKLHKHRWRVAIGAGCIALCLGGVRAGFWWAERSAESREELAAINARKDILRIQRAIDAGNVNFVKTDGLMATNAYMTYGVQEALLVAARTKYEVADEDLLKEAIWLLNDALGPAPDIWPPEKWSAAMLLSEMLDVRADITLPDSEEAIEAITKDRELADELRVFARQHMPNTPDGWYVRSFATLVREDAIRYAQEAVERDPLHELAWDRLAYLYFQRRDFERAKEAADQLIRLSKATGGPVQAWQAFRDRLDRESSDVLAPAETTTPVDEPIDATPEVDDAAGTAESPDEAG